MNSIHEEVIILALDVKFRMNKIYCYAFKNCARLKSGAQKPSLLFLTSTLPSFLIVIKKNKTYATLCSNNN